MINKIKLGLIVGIVTGFCSVALADEQVNCEAGQKKAAFADGNSVTEVCVDAAEMEETVANPEVPVGVDSSNTDGHTEG